MMSATDEGGATLACVTATLAGQTMACVPTPQTLAPTTALGMVNVILAAVTVSPPAFLFEYSGKCAHFCQATRAGMATSHQLPESLVGPRCVRWAQAHVRANFCPHLPRVYCNN